MKISLFDYKNWIIFQFYILVFSHLQTWRGKHKLKGWICYLLSTLCWVCCANSERSFQLGERLFTNQVRSWIVISLQVVNTHITLYRESRPRNQISLNQILYSGGNLTNRIVWALLIEVIVFVMTIILAMVDTSEWPGAFCYLTIASVILLNGK